MKFFILVAFLSFALTPFGARAATSTPPPATTIYGTNLVVNGDAEADVGAPDDKSVVKPTGWTTTGTFTAVQYGASGGFPAPNDVGPSARGKNLFEGGNGPKATASQAISLTAAGTDIGKGVVFFALSAYLGGYQNQRDDATVSVVFRDANGKAIGSGKTIGPVTKLDRDKGTGTGSIARSATGPVPKGAVSAIVTITITRYDGIYNDGEVDNVSLVLTKSS